MMESTLELKKRYKLAVGFGFEGSYADWLEVEVMRLREGVQSIISDMNEGRTDTMLMIGEVESLLLFVLDNA